MKLKRLTMLALSALSIVALASCGKKETKEKKENHTEIDRCFKYEYVYDKDSRTIICSKRKDENSEYVFYHKYYTKYDKHDYVIEECDYLLDEDGKWEGNDRTVYEYSDNYSKLREISYECYETDYGWIWRYEDQTYYEYTTIKGKKYESTIIYYNGYGDDPKEDEMDEKMLYTYDSKGNLTQYDKYEYDEDEKEWIFDSKTIVTADDNSQTTETEYVQKGDSLVEAYKTVYTHDKDGNDIKEEGYRYVDSKWTLVIMLEYKYEKGKCVEESYYDVENGKTQLYYKGEYIYSEDGFEIGHIGYREDEGIIYPHSKVEYVTDKFDNNEFDICYSWNRDSQTWELV